MPYSSRWIGAVLVVALGAMAARAGNAETYPTLMQQFEVPARQAHPWVYWVWLGANTRRADLTRDLEAMKATGITGCILYGNQAGTWSWHTKLVLIGKHYREVTTNEYKGSYCTPVPTGPLPAWTPRWRKLVCFAAGQCARLGISLVVSNGLANTSGPIPIKYGEQTLVWTKLAVRGPMVFDGKLPAFPVYAPGGSFPRTGAPTYSRNVAVLAVPNKSGVSAGQVVNLTSQMSKSGHLRWHVPAGQWTILRFEQVPTGAHNFWGYFTNSMSATALDKTWAVTMAPLLRAMTPSQRTALKGIEDDSWEAGPTTWTKRFPEEFKKRRGYDLLPYLPILAGIKMADASTRARVLSDYRLTISDLIAANHYGHLKALANKNGLICYSEAAGPNYSQADDLKTSSRVDRAMAEFWMPCTHRPSMNSRFLLRNAANANHIYGKRITMCEAFTSLGPEWQESPFTMKPVADQAFCDGCNRVCIHNFSQSPSLTAKPGYDYVAGTHYEPGITWWHETPAFNLYLARCSSMLQAGMFHADALVYRGSNIGRGEPRKMLLPTLGHGYDHDNCNSEVLLTRTSVADGRIVLADGMHYHVLILPSTHPMPLADLAKIAALVKAGATIVGPPPASMQGMPVHAGEQAKFNALVARLWGGLDGRNHTEKHLGAGRVFWGNSAREVLRSQGNPPDFAVRGVGACLKRLVRSDCGPGWPDARPQLRGIFENMARSENAADGRPGPQDDPAGVFKQALSPEGTIEWIHRTCGSSEIYFVASRWAHPEHVVCTFRQSGRQPQLWNPVTGAIRSATAFTQAHGCTSIPLQFGPCGSVFVVFHKKISSDAHGTTQSNYTAATPLLRLTGPWSVHFDPKWGGPAGVVFSHLIDWTHSSNAGIKYYSGTAVYQKTFELPELPPVGSHVLLDLGTVDNVATVRLNGKDLGVVWTKPAQIDITHAVKAQHNMLEIRVVNLWPNRLIGDASLPKATRFTRTNIHKFTPASPLLPSGLLGPVWVLIQHEP